jgi:hypothetical protein
MGGLGERHLTSLQALERRMIGTEHLPFRGQSFPRPHPRLEGLQDTLQSRSTHTQDYPTPHSGALPIPSQRL